ncbi:MAG: FHA domain-containing serine/threonine-protein kinase [Pseudomonadota bacterium]
MKISLEIVKGPDKGHLFSLPEASTTYVAGRGGKAKIKFGDSDPYISRHHFLLEVAPPRVYFKDLDVTNPSQVNGFFVDEAELSDGDLIEVGYTKLRVRLQHNSAPPPGPADPPANAPPAATREQDDASRQTQAQGQEAPTPPLGLCTLRCHRCGSDVSNLASSDGRAAHLGEIPIYCCPHCLPSRVEEPSKLIGPYRPIKTLGHGGMGEVFLVYHPATARLLALKKMSIDNPILGARFDREIFIMRELYHDKLIAYVDNGCDAASGKPYLVMEYAPLGSLEELIRKCKGLVAPPLAGGYILQALEGLAFLHQNNVLHRDLKPENILLKETSSLGVVAKIGDFGLSRQFSGAGGTVLTRLGMAMGTVLYMPPEQVEDAHSVKEPADLYSIGATLYHMLTGKYPFNFPTPQELARLQGKREHTQVSPLGALKQFMRKEKLRSPQLIVLEDKPIAVRKRNPHIPEALAKVVDKSLNKDIARRYATAQEFRTDLAQALDKIRG